MEASRVQRLAAAAARHAPRVLRVGAMALLGAVLLLVGYALVLLPFTPAVDKLLAARDDKPSVLLAADGSVLATFRRTPREWVPLARIPTHVVDALIATEDHRFWQHPGVDWRRSLSAVAHSLAGDAQGGSTITQQLARNAFPEEVGRARTATRKLKELITAIKLERRYSKREILEAYLNTVSFHYNAFGIEMAARTYFDKPAQKLTVAEGATLIGLLKGTRVYNPVLHPQRALERRNVVLAQMLKHGKLTAAEHQRMRQRPLRLDFERQDLGTGPAPHFAEAVRRWLLGWSEPLGLDLYADGLMVQSAIDPKLQRIANQAVARQLDALQAVADVEWGRSSAALLSTRSAAYVQARGKTEPFGHFWSTRRELVDEFVRESPEYAELVDAGHSKDEAVAALRSDAGFMAALRERKTRLEAGFVAIDPTSGAVRAWVGSRDHGLGAFDHVQRSRRQPGSTFKPFVYAAALEAGIAPQREFDTRGVSLRLPNGTRWQPRDMGAAPDGRSTMEDGLVFSRNSVTAQLIGEVGADTVQRMAQRLGVRESPLEAVPSLALGTSPVSLLEMTSAYATIAAQGEFHTPLLVTKVSDANGRLLMQVAPAAGTPGERVMDSRVAVELIDMLRGAVDRGTGQGVRGTWGIQADVAGKTGTTQNNTDGWFILMQPQLVAGAWVGFNDPRVTLRSEHWGQGAHNALHVVGDAMRQALAQRLVDPRAEFPSAAGAALREFVRSAGETLRRWFGIAEP
ncbi:transglycosylase domain-containing protein [uncultured Piscinibacter sp.]|uniref:penicillin-binding protein 1A n=1 Tax=uncultured Piscinibacter sp. TaxID=1131835 RepID=UPI0026165734|nr:transglycosylase domain-containing protein [uncultured Piscinibacter sp.]